MTAASFGVALWGIASVILSPLLLGRHAGWSWEEMRNLFPALVGWILFGFMFGLLLQTFEDIAEQRFGAEVIPHLRPFRA